MDIESADSALEDEKTADEIGGVTIESDVKDKDKGKGKEMGSNKSRNGKPERTIPRWISEKQSSDGGRARLNDPKPPQTFTQRNILLDIHLFRDP